MNFLDPLHMRNTHSDFQLPTSKTDLTYNRSQMGAILPPGTILGGGVGGGELNFLDLHHMINTHTNFHISTSKTVILLIIAVKWGRFYPLGPSLGGGGWGRGVEFPRSASYDKHTYQFSASYLQD